MNAAVFLDRDGVLNRDEGYTHRIDDLELLAGVPEALASLKKYGFKLIVITNQSGVARGYYGLPQVHAFHDAMNLKLQDYGVMLDGYYICPHHPKGSVAKYSVRCECRKPGVLLVKQAVTDHQIDSGRSFFVGDKDSDMVCAHEAGLTGIHILGRYSPKMHELAAASAISLLEAANWILERV